MSMDDGVSDVEGFGAPSEFASKIAALLQEFEVGFDFVCREQKVDRDKVYRAIQQGTDGFPPTIELLNKFLAYFEVDVSYLISATIHREYDLTSRRRQLRTLAWDFILKYGIPKARRKPLADYVANLADRRSQHTLLGAARRGVPMTVVHIGYIYQELLAKGELK